MEQSKMAYYWVREDILPEALQKTMQAKLMLQTGQVKTVHEAVELVGLSRSAFYKYKDGVLLPSEWRREWMVTISMLLIDQAGMLSKVLSLVAEIGGNVLTINQTIPLQGVATVLLTVDMSKQQQAIEQLKQRLQQEDGIRDVQLLGQG